MTCIAQRCVFLWVEAESALGEMRVREREGQRVGRLNVARFK